MNPYTCVLTIPKDTNYSITHQDDKTIITITGNISSSKGVDQVKLRQLIDKYKVCYEKEGYGSVFVEFKSLSGCNISDKEIKNYIEKINNSVEDVEEYIRIGNNKLRIGFYQVYNNPEAAKYFATTLNGTQYSEWMITASTPEYVESSQLKVKGWLLIKSPDDSLKKVLSKYGILRVLQEIKPHIYVACYTEGQASDAWTDSFLANLNKPDSYIDERTVIRKLTEEDVMLLE